MISPFSCSPSSWADDVDDLDDLPKPTETVGPDGIITIVEWKLDEEDRKVKVTRRVRRRLQTSEVSHTVAERKHWSKFGAEKGKSAGPDRATTTVGENINFKVQAGGQKEPEEDAATKAKAVVGTKRIMCRFCKGDHYTSKCPLKETLEGAGMGDMLGGDMGPADDGPGAGPSGSGPSKYVPP
jgi:translation initiation factor 3 subunit G